LIPQLLYTNCLQAGILIFPDNASILSFFDALRAQAFVTGRLLAEK